MVDVHVADTADYFRRVFEDEFGSWASTTQTGPSGSELLIFLP
jgi:hypothetical protein